MRILGLSLGKEKPVAFMEFRDMVRLAVRKSVPGARLEPNDTGFTILREGENPITCNLRSLYVDYSRAPQNRESLIHGWVASLVTDVPEHTWTEAQMTLRPTVKPADYLVQAQKQMQKAKHPDNLPYAPFAGEVSVIIMRDLPGTVVAVTESMLADWQVGYGEALKVALNNMNMLTFPPVANALTASGAARGTHEEIGLVFEGDHLTATWIIMERFRDYVWQRLQGDFVVSVPMRNRLIAIRADEPGLIGQITSSSRAVAGQTHAVTTQCFHVSGTTTGGIVTVYKPGASDTRGEVLDPNSLFARGGQSAVSYTAPPTFERARPVDLSVFGGLSEPTERQ